MSESGACAAFAEACETLDARRVASEDAEDVVASRRYSTTSQVCNVASGAKETRRFAAYSQINRDCKDLRRVVAPRDLRRASRRFFSSSSFEANMDLTAGMNADYKLLANAC